MNSGIGKGRCVSLLVVVTLLLSVLAGGVYAQRGERGQDPSGNGRRVAPIDLTGTWVSVITEEWQYRMVTPAKGYFFSDQDYSALPHGPGMDGEGGAPTNREGWKIAIAWDPAKDEAAGEQCKSYGAFGGMRLPGYLRVSWQDDSTLKMELTAGNQVRLFNFGAKPAPAGAPTWQGHSVAEWEHARRAPGDAPNGNLKVVTTRLRPQYARKNGIPISANANLEEHYFRYTTPDGNQWLVVTAELTDPQYYDEPWTLTSHFKKVPDNSRPWNPRPCSAR
jgi:hypothetical protein